MGVADDVRRTGESGLGLPVAAQIAMRVASHFGVDVHAMLRAGNDRLAFAARASLCGELLIRGWSADQIERYYGIPHGWATAALRSSPEPEGERTISGEHAKVDLIETERLEPIARRPACLRCAATRYYRRGKPVRCGTVAPEGSDPSRPRCVWHRALERRGQGDEDGTIDRAGLVGE